jgi:HEAT repeat protein
MGSCNRSARRALIAIAGDPSCKQELRAAAADALSELGPEAAEAVPLLLKALSDPQLHFTPFARALWKIDRRQAPAVVRAANAFLTQEEYTGGAASILEEIGPEAKDAVPALIKHLSEERDEPSTDSPARALAAIGPPAVPALVEVLAGDDMVLSSIAAETLGRIGAGAAAAIPALEKAVSGEDDEVRREAVKALGRIRKSGAPPPQGPSAAGGTGAAPGTKGG